MRGYIIAIPIFLFIFTQHVLACMPHLPDEVFIARYKSTQKKMADPVKFDLDFGEQKFIFRTFYQRFTMGYPEIIESEFEFRDLKPNDLVIGLAYTADGGKPELYTLSALAQLNCKDDQLFIGKTLGSFLAWDRKEHRCKLSDTNYTSILDGFLEKNQVHYLQELQSQYPTFNALKKAFPYSAQSDFYSIFVQKIHVWLF